MLILYNVKAECEKEFPNFQLKTFFIEPVCNVVLIGYTENVNEIENRINGIISSIKRFPIEDFKNDNQVQYLDKNQSELFKLIQENGIKCSIEIDTINGLIYGDFINENEFDRLKSLINDFLKKANLNEPISAKLDVELHESRLILIHSVERNIRKQFEEVQITRNKRKIELFGDYDHVNGCIKFIKRFLESIISEEFSSGDANGVMLVKNSEKDFVLSLKFDPKILCVVNFDIDKNLFIIYSNNRESIELCKNHIKEYIDKIKQ